MADPDELKQHENSARENILTGLDSMIVKVLELLLIPIREDINNLRSEVHAKFKESAQLCEENSQLFKQVQSAEEKNKELTKRVIDLETKILESHVLIRGIQESPSETEEDRHEKIFIALSDTLLGRTKEERLNIAQGMLIKSTKRIGIYRSMWVWPISMEFLHKTDTEYLLQNRKYLSDGIYVDKEYCKEVEKNRMTL